MALGARPSEIARPRELGLRRVFVTGVIALTCVLLVSLTLVGRSLHNVLSVNPGFDARGVLTLQVSVPAAKYPGDEQLASFYSALHRAVEGRLGPGSGRLSGRRRRHAPTRAITWT